MQPMAELVEQRDHLVVGEQCRPATDRPREVAVQVGDRRLDLAPAAPARDRVVHPRAPAFGVARVKVHVELADARTERVADLEKTHVLVPYRRGGRGDAHAIERLHQPEQTCKDRVFRKVLLHLVVRKVVALGAQLLRRVGDVPGFELVYAQRSARELAQLDDVALGRGARAGGEIVEEGEHLRGRFGHLRLQRDLGEARIAEQPRLFLAQLEHARDERRVVPFRPAEFRSPGNAFAVHGCAQPAVVGVLH